ncbi:non-ribosomal peptide synthetase, partial [Streptomyces mexicanus]|nr:non-ribosomal peptide synthetase [Streptomyces mexicanus]
PANFTLIMIARGYDLQLHACPADPSHPHIELVQ